MTLLLRYLPYLIGAVAVFGVGAWTGNALNPWHGRYQGLQVADAQARADGESAVRKDLQGKLDALRATLKTNNQITVDLAHANAQIARDRDANLALARRLLNGQARRPSGGGVPQTPNQPRTPPAGGTGPDESVAGLLVNTADECDRNANRLDALIAQIKPQL